MYLKRSIRANLPGGKPAQTTDSEEKTVHYVTLHIKNISQLTIKHSRTITKLKLHTMPNVA